MYIILLYRAYIKIKVYQIYEKIAYLINITTTFILFNFMNKNNYFKLYFN